MDTIRLALIALLTLSFTSQADTEFSNKASLEFSSFPDAASSNQQSSSYASGAIEVEAYTSFNDDSSFNLKLFARGGDSDSNRNHSDIREAVYLTTGEDWELRAGITKVYWGVTEANHLVDIINQTDAVESLDGEEKLGQLMVNYTLLTEQGNWDFFVLPGFRERTFAGIKGRPSTSLAVKTANSTYESSDKQNHIDVAVRWSHSIDDLDIAISQFIGTSRFATLKAAGFVANTPTFLAPHYAQISQTGIELQYISEDLIWKAEIIGQSTKTTNYSAATLGIESTLVGILESDADLGILTELMTDSRVAGTNNPFQKDIFMGGRLVLNDAQSTEGIAGFILDLDSNATIFSLEASRRLGDDFKLNIESRFYDNVASDAFFKNIKQDSYLKAELEYYF